MKNLPFTLILFVAISGIQTFELLIADEYDNHIREGNNLYTTGEFIQAEESYLKAQNEKPTEAAPQFNIGNTFFKREDFPKAIEHYLNAIDKLRADRALEAKIRYNLATARVKESEKTIGDLTDQKKLQTSLDFLKEAITGYRDVLEIQPEHKNARHNLSLTQLRIKKLLDDLKKLKEQQEKEQPKGPTPEEFLLERIKEEKAEIKLTTEALNAGESSEKFKKRVQQVTEIQKSVGSLTPESAPGQKQSILEAMKNLENDPSFEIGAAEFSKARKEFESSSQGTQKSIEESLSRLNEKSESLEKSKSEKIAKDIEDQTTTQQKTYGFSIGLNLRLQGKDLQSLTGQQQGKPPQPQQQQPPPIPEELKPIVKKISELSLAASQDMTEALKLLKGEDSKFESSVDLAAKILQDDSGEELKRALERAQRKEDGDDKNPLQQALWAQISALDKLYQALEEARKLPKDENKEQQQQNQKDQDKQNKDQQNQDNKDQNQSDENSDKKEGDDNKEQEGEKGEDQEDKDQEQKDPEQKDQEGENSDQNQEQSEEEKQQQAQAKEQKLSEEEARRLLQKFLQHDAKRERDKKKREMRLRARGGRSLEKDW